MNGDSLQKTDGSAIQSTSEGFGTSAITRANETASTAVAAQARAQIEARYIVAMRNPRDWDNVRMRLLKECMRPGFAKVARYSKPVAGSKIEGPSIRFAEAAIRCMGNIAPETMVIWDDDDKRIIRVSVTDIENNLPYAADVVISKTVERRFLQDGQVALSSRMNSQGKLTYTVRATEDDLLNKQNAQVSKALRTLALRILPGDILEESMNKVMEVQRNEDAKDPDAARKGILDAFAKMNVMPSQLAEYLGHGTDQLVPAELIDLRAIYAALSDGDTTWAALMASKRAPADSEPSAAQTAVDKVKERLKKPAPKQEVIDTKTGEVVT